MNLILQCCVWTEQLPTGFIIHSSVNKLRDIYALHYLLCFFHFHRILICFNWTLTSHAYCISYNHLGCWSNTGSQFIVVVVWFFIASLYTALPLDSLKSLHTGRSNAGMYKNYLFKPTNHFMRAKCLNMTVFFNYLCTFWPLMTFLMASVLMCSIPYDCWCFFPPKCPHQVPVTQLKNADEKLRSGFMKCVDNVNSRTAYLSPAVKVEK